MRAPQVAWFCSAAWPDFTPALTRLRHSRQDLPDVFLTMEEMKSVLSSVSGHAPHDIDFELGASLAFANLPYRQATDAMSEFTTLRDDFKRLMKMGADGPEERRMAFEELDFRLKVYHSIDDPQERKEIMAMIKDGDYGRKRSKWR
ncbi:hypothetical protein AX760_25060 [Pararhizobium antarcticum]|uniref:Uncharacterized protein n=2 Tax=Pararhizobium antarcticum TaxID=1798805 RepID=A0A657LZI0_9HYPH|nr:hypothetical protein AX761_05350 [Rhizobium sp. 58]OJG00945.1 hypothetical protein AX760_25060 [Pararhizobium antarcticum]